MMHVDVDEIGDTGLFLEDSGLDEGLPSVSELSHGSMHVVPQPFGQGSCSGRGSKKRCKSVICGCVECVEESRRFSSAWSTHRMRIHERNSKGLVSGEKLVSGDGIGNVGMSSSSKVPTCWSGFCGLKGPEGFCEGSGDLVSQFRGRLTVFKTKFGTFLNDCDTCSKFSQFVRYSSVVMPLLSRMIRLGGCLIVVLLRLCLPKGLPLAMGCPGIQADTKVISSRQLMVLQSRCQAKLRLG